LHSHYSRLKSLPSSNPKEDIDNDNRIKLLFDLREQHNDHSF